jgi:hypothetical protein
MKDYFSLNGGTMNAVPGQEQAGPSAAADGTADSSFTKWWKGALERAGKTVAQTLATSLIGAGLAMITFTTFRNAAIVALFAGLATLAVSPFTVSISNGGSAGTIESFAANAAVRCVFTFGETLAGLVVAAKGFDYITFAWASALSQATVAALLSILTSVASSNPGEPKSPSLVKGVK